MVFINQQDHSAVYFDINGIFEKYHLAVYIDVTGGHQFSIDFSGVYMY